MIYLVALAARSVMEANAACFKCREPLLAPRSMRVVFESCESVYACPECLPRDKAGDALITVSIGEQVTSLARSMDAARERN